MPVVKGYHESIAQSFYDTLRLGKGQTFDRFEMFQQATSEKENFGDTNMMLPGRVVFGYTFVARRLWIELLHACPEDLSALKSDCTVYLLVNNTTYFRMPASVLVLENTFSKIIQAIQKKKLRVGRRFQEATTTLQLGLLVEPITIDAFQSFSVRVSTSNPIVLVDKFAARMFCEGSLYRPVH